MKAIEAWLNQGDPATLRKLTVFADKYGDDGAPEQWRACCMAGSTNGLVAYGKGETVPDALAALDKLLASQGASVLGSYEDPDADAPELEATEKACAACDGYGRVGIDPETTCKACGGSGNEADK